MAATAWMKMSGIYKKKLYNKFYYARQYNLIGFENIIMKIQMLNMIMQHESVQDLTVEKKF